MSFPNQIYKISSGKDFNRICLETFRYQVKSLPVYAEFIHQLGIDEARINQSEDIPFLPVEFFRDHRIIANDMKSEKTFFSSGTTSQKAGKHYVADVSVYEQSFITAFQLYFGDPSGYCMLALLPSYLEREGSSLVYMMDALIRSSGHRNSGFYLDEHERLMDLLMSLKKSGQKTILLGVSFALMELAEKYPEDLSGITLIETGGMKGRRKEMIREELHGFLCEGFKLEKIHSEYGMTELLSQAWSMGDGIFSCPPWMKISIRDPYDPFTFLPAGKSGIVCITDLANRYSCSFIATSDLGRLHEDGRFEILGRMDHSDIRGCNLLVQ